MDSCIGSVLSVDCGKGGYFQGKLVALDVETKNITLSRAFKDGFLLGKNVVLYGTDIVSVKVLKLPDAPARPASTTTLSVKKSSPKKEASKTVDEGLQLHRSKSVSSAPCPSKQQSNNWISRPVQSENNDKLDMETTSGSNSGRNSPSDNHSRSSQSRSRRSKPKHESQKIENTPTPLYKRFEPQVPKPQGLTAPTWAIKGSKREKGPCGIPILDVRNGYGRIFEQNADLNKPIDFQMLQTDFDFDANLELFQKRGNETDDEEFFETEEKPKMSQNFAHYENIISDPSRITSWTTMAAKGDAVNKDTSTQRMSPVVRSLLFSTSGFEKSADGHRLPVLDKDIKAKYVKECISLLSSHVYYSLVADRLLVFLFDTLQSTEIISDIVVITGKATPQHLIDRISTHLENRGYTATFLIENAVKSHRNGITRVDKTESLPSHATAVLVISEEPSELAMKWISKQTDADIVALEANIPLVNKDKMHVLMVGTLTSGLYESASKKPILGRASFAQLCGATESHRLHAAVCDIGAPFGWIENGKEALMDAFGRQLFVSV